MGQEEDAGTAQGFGGPECSDFTRRVSGPWRFKASEVDAWVVRGGAAPDQGDKG